MSDSASAASSSPKEEKLMFPLLPLDVLMQFKPGNSYSPKHHVALRTLDVITYCLLAPDCVTNDSEGKATNVTVPSDMKLMFQALSKNQEATKSIWNARIKRIVIAYLNHIRPAWKQADQEAIQFFFAKSIEHIASIDFNTIITWEKPSVRQIGHPLVATFFTKINGAITPCDPEIVTGYVDNLPRYINDLTTKAVAPKILQIEMKSLVIDLSEVPDSPIEAAPKPIEEPAPKPIEEPAPKPIEKPAPAPVASSSDVTDLGKDLAPPRQRLFKKRSIEETESDHAPDVDPHDLFGPGFEVTLMEKRSDDARSTSSSSSGFVFKKQKKSAHLVPERKLASSIGDKLSLIGTLPTKKGNNGDYPFTDSWNYSDDATRKKWLDSGVTYNISGNRAKPFIPQISDYEASVDVTASEFGASTSIKIEFNTAHVPSPGDIFNLMVKCFQNPPSVFAKMIPKPAGEPEAEEEI